MPMPVFFNSSRPLSVEDVAPIVASTVGGLAFCCFVMVCVGPCRLLFCIIRYFSYRSRHPKLGQQTSDLSGLSVYVFMDIDEMKAMVSVNDET
jgi:hypothetical protein